MLQTKWCQYYVTCLQCYDYTEPHMMFIYNDSWPETCDKCGQKKAHYTVEMVPGSWKKEGYTEEEMWKGQVECAKNSQKKQVL